MSLISELLSRVKQTELKKGIPPGLPYSIGSSKKRQDGKKRLVLLSAAIVSSVALGIFTLHIADTLTSKTQVRPVQTVRDSDASSDAPDKNKVVPTFPQHIVSSSTQLESGKAVPTSTAETASATVERKFSVTALDTKSPIPPREIEGPKKSDQVKNVPYGEAENEGSAKTREDTLAHLLYLASGYERTGNDASAIASYRKALQLDPLNYKMTNNIASILLRSGSVDEAMQYLEESLAIQDDYVPALVNMGISLAGKGMFAEAEASFNKALIIEPASAPVLLNLAILYENRGQIGLAKEHYGRLRALGHPQGEAGLKRLR